MAIHPPNKFAGLLARFLINEEYGRLLEEAKKNDKRKLYFRYLDILRRDPQLPKELLPEDWKGEEAYSLFKEFGQKFK